MVHGERSAEVVKARKQFNDVMRSSRAIIDRLKEAGREAMGEIREMRQQDDNWRERQSQSCGKLANAAHAHVVTMDASACRFRLFDNG